MNTKTRDPKSMSIDELWALHLKSLPSCEPDICRKTQLEAPEAAAVKGVPNGKLDERRPYPQVFPKYRNPAEPSET
jgi:DNA-binding protein H-NS